MFREDIPESEWRNVEQRYRWSRKPVSGELVHTAKGWAILGAAFIGCWAAGWGFGMVMVVLGAICAIAFAHGHREGYTTGFEDGYDHAKGRKVLPQAVHRMSTNSTEQDSTQQHNEPDAQA
jgi:fatty acid desaturase